MAAKPRYVVSEALEVCFPPFPFLTTTDLVSRKTCTITPPRSCFQARSPRTRVLSPPTHCLYVYNILFCRNLPVLKATQSILRKHRFDLPIGIENNPADFAKVIAAVQEAFTQLRAKFKKAVRFTFHSCLRSIASNSWVLFSCALASKPANRTRSLQRGLSSKIFSNSPRSSSKVLSARSLLSSVLALL